MPAQVQSQSPNQSQAPGQSRQEREQQAAVQLERAKVTQTRVIGTQRGVMWLLEPIPAAVSCFILKGISLKSFFDEILLDLILLCFFFNQKHFLESLCHRENCTVMSELQEKC